jgi:CelD/BcsL family acetyltransferase involved in cellulose biosynthesis
MPATDIRPSSAPRDRSASAAELDPLTDPRWADFIARTPGAGPFQHPAWLELIRAHYGWPVRACCLVDAGAVRAGLPVALVSSRLTGRRLVALPFSDSCPPLAAEGEQDALAHELDGYRRRANLPLLVHGPVPRAPVIARYHAHRLSLDGGFAAVQDRYARPQVLRGVRRALREGLVAERRTDAAALAAFYRLHAGNRRRLGVPTQPRRFIMRFGDLFARGLGFVMLVVDAGRPVAGALFLSWNGTLVYKYGASDDRALLKRPNNLLFHEAIRLACLDGMRVLDFGRTDLGHESLRAFKLGFGPQESELAYTLLADRPRLWGGPDLSGLAAPVIRRCPPVVSRLAGELFYRHAGR